MILYERPCHGYAIIEAPGLRLGRHVGPETVYPFLTALLNARYLSSRLERVVKRARISYSMMPKGRKFAESTLKRLSKIVSSALEPNISRCAHCVSKLYEPSHAEKIESKLRAFCCVHCARAFKLE